jgi:hypothetical protein
MNIGEGILPSGTGQFSHAGVYALASDADAGAFPGTGRIELITNQGLGSDIRGDIVSNTGIGQINLNGGSIVNADIMVIAASAGAATTDTGGTGGTGGTDLPASTFTGADFLGSNEFAGNVVIRQGKDANGNVFGNIGSINITGIGGIIGMLAEANNIGNTTVSGGFGIFNSIYSTLGNGRIGAVSATGFGIRGVTFDGGQSVQSLTSIGQGRASVLGFSPTVRFSDVTGSDPYSGMNFNELNDINRVLLTSAAVPVIRGNSNRGVIDNTSIRVSRDVAVIDASQLRNVLFNVPNLIGTVHTRDYVVDASITAGRIDTISIGGDTTRMNFNVSGPVGLAAFGKSFRGSSSLIAGGPAGTIGTLIVKGSLYGNISASKGIGTIDVRKHVGSFNIHSGTKIDHFFVGGSMVAGTHVTVDGTLAELIVGGDVLDGAIIEAHPLAKKTVKGLDQGEYRGS